MAWSLEQVMGMFGGTLASIMFLSGFEVAADIVKRKSVGQYSPFPYFVQILNCTLWVVYATAEFHTGHMFWPLACNAVGLVVASCVYTIYLTFSTPAVRTAWLPSLLPCALTVVLGVVILWSRTPALVAFAGSACLVVNVVMYAGPLAGIHRALTSKSTEFLPFSLGLTTVLCATPWLFFGVAVNNRNIYIPNTIGVICGSCQVVVWIYVSRIEDKMSDRSDERSPLEEGSLKTT